MTMIPEVSTSGVALFARYDRTFQEKVLQALLSDKDWASQMVEVMTPEYFELKYLRYLGDKYFEHYRAHRTFPSLALLATMVRDDLREGNSQQALQTQVLEYMQRLKFNPDLGDLPRVKEMALNFCRKQAMKDALSKAVDLVEMGKNEEVVAIIKDAVAVGIPASVGHDFVEDREARFQKTDRRPVPTGLRELDEILNGGLGKGELGTITAATGVGKSHMLVSFGAHAARLGKNVIHYTFELSETNVGLRYDSNFCNIPSNEIPDHKDEVYKVYEDLELGRIIIKYYPTGSASVFTLRSHIEKLMMKSFVPSLILIDYADIMRSSRQYDSLRHELKLIYEELRNLAYEFNVPIWTASQSNREGESADVIGLSNMSEAYGKAMVADAVITISRKPQEKAHGTGRLFVAKNRAGRDGILFNIGIDTACSKFKIVDDEFTLGEAMSSDKKDMKKMLNQKWNELKSEKGKRENSVAENADPEATTQGDIKQ
jgi:hypothetical protein